MMKSLLSFWPFFDSRTNRLRTFSILPGSRRSCRGSMILAATAAPASRAGAAVAAKIMLPRQDLLDPGKIENVRKRFVRESKNGQKLNSDFIITHLDYGEVEDTAFLVMELAQKSAKDLLKDAGGHF